jgi:hypothetical protein
MMGAITIFGESIFIFSFVIMDWWQSQLGRVHIWGGDRENKMPKDECEFFTTKLGWIISFHNKIRSESSHLVDKGKIPWSYYIL